MAKIANAKIKTTSGGYLRVFNNNELGSLVSRVQSTVISNGNELEKLILERTTNIDNLNDFIDNTTKGITADGVYVCTKKILKKSRYAIDNIEPDLLVFLVQQARICKVIELKDGDNFDTKKAKGEKENLEKFATEFGAKIPFVAEYYVCAFNQENKEQIVAGFKHEFTLEHVMTGKELCKLLNISYDEIIEIRKQDGEENFIYFIEQLLNIPKVKEKICEKLGEK